MNAPFHNSLGKPIWPHGHARPADGRRERLDADVALRRARRHRWTAIGLGLLNVVTIAAVSIASLPSGSAVAALKTIACAIAAIAIMRESRSRHREGHGWMVAGALIALGGIVGMAWGEA